MMRTLVLNFFTFSAPRGGGGRVWKGLGRFWEGLGGFARFGKVWAGLVGLEGWRRVGTLQKDMGGFGKVWKDLGGFGNAKIIELSPKTTIWESLAGFGKI